MNWTHVAPPLGPLATLLASQQFLLDFTQLLLTSATLFLASEGWNEMLSGFFLTGIQMSWLYGGRRSRVSRLTRVKGNQALSFCEDARYPPKRLLHAGQKTNEKPTCSDRSYSQPQPRGLLHWRILHTRVVIWTSCVWELNPDPCRGSSVWRWDRSHLGVRLRLLHRETMVAEISRCVGGNIRQRLQQVVIVWQCLESKSQ